ncbi:ParB/RepB/Spo0J family partition protein [Rugosimonospora africana]|uniref:ParB-like N-terminal domain-containing protein n=1 Tax=Rugosimonospora africana TaxID=556532 RepID=A0A8J3VWQ7_9ACTN|nr:ParB N-terminal domain-containing protein [Rugosimonospora africana]GIH21043.1 hypothetical protein Raf01_92150 [Rugosimonospora africana]
MPDQANALVVRAPERRREERAQPGRLAAVPDLAGGKRSGQWVPVRALRAGDSPRLAGESAEHARVLAESGAALPPILVHRASMRVIDGMHRLLAAELRGDQTIEVEFFDGPDDDTFVAAVRANIAHGLPLTLEDRQAAAARILVTYPHYSDRSIAQIAGLAAGTVREIRQRSAPARDDAGAARVGLDGRVRPLCSADTRRRARDAIVQRPDASLREIARTVGLSPTTVRDVRDRMRRGEDPVPDRAQAGRGPRADGGGATPPDPGASRKRLLENLGKDPSLRFTDSGRSLLRALFARCAGPPDLHLLRSLPPHCVYTIASLARACAEDWLRFAEELPQHVRSAATGTGPRAHR